MVKQHSNRRRHLSREHRAIWWEAFRDYRRLALSRDGNTVERSLAAITRLASTAAWADLDEYVRAVKKQRP